MERKSLSLEITLLWLGLALYLLRFPILEAEKSIYAFREPYFSSPVPAVDGKVRIRVDSYGKGYFGASRNGGRTHKGLDLRAELGEPILASKSGRVFSAGPDGSYGLCVELRHPDGLLTRYAHLSEVLVEKGDWVGARQPIGRCGKTGNASNPSILPHVHYEIRYKNNVLNPAQDLFDPSIRFE